MCSKLKGFITQVATIFIITCHAKTILPTYQQTSFKGSSNNLSVYDGNSQTVEFLNFDNKRFLNKFNHKNSIGFYWQIDLPQQTELQKIEFDWDKAPTKLVISYRVNNGWQQHNVNNITKKHHHRLAVKTDSVKIIIPKDALKGKISLRDIKLINKQQKDCISQLYKKLLSERKVHHSRLTSLIAKTAKTEEFIYVNRGHVNDGHWYANFGYYAQDPQKKAFSKGGQLNKINIRTGKITTLLEDPQGTFRDPAVHYDGKTIIFSYRKGGSDIFHLYEIQSDGTNLTQLTDGYYDDIEPCYLPNDEIMFVSARARRWVNCWITPVATLHKCDRNGDNIRQISANIEHDNTPWVMNDGKIVYQRWEYIDRSQVNFHHLWSTNPDGTSQMVYFGNMHAGGVFIDAKPIPNSNRLVFIHSPAHGRREHCGRIATVSDQKGPDERSEIKFLTRSNEYRDPYALSEKLFIAAKNEHFVAIDELGAEQVLFSNKKYGWLHEPRPIVKRQRERVIPERVDYKKTHGTLILTDVYEGRNMKGVKRGEIKKLLVMESLPKPINYTGSMEPMTYGGSFTLERILGTVPVELDGSAHFKIPANRSIFLIALDKNDSSVKRMQSFLSVMPGEVASCIGCHEERNQTPTTANQSVLMALSRPASKIKPIKGIPDVYDYPRDIQPILDRNCVSCHNPKNRKGGIILTGDHGPFYSHSFYNLTVHKQIKDGRNLPRGNHGPREIGDSASPLMEKLNGIHHDVEASPEEIRKVRYWLHAGATYLGTYAALGCGMIGTDVWNHQIDRTVDNFDSVKVASKVLEKRCFTCHSGRYHIPRTPCAPEMWRRWRPEAYNIVGQYENKFLNHIIYNYTRPELSTILLASLSKKAGGYSACRAIDKNGKVIKDQPVITFKSKNDPDYQLLLKAIQDIKKQHDKDPRWNMPGFIPPPEYIREMKKYGILDERIDPKETPVNFYQLDRKYWDTVSGYQIKSPTVFKNSKVKEMVKNGTLKNQPKAQKGKNISIPDDIFLKCVQ